MPSFMLELPVFPSDKFENLCNILSSNDMIYSRDELCTCHWKPLPPYPPPHPGETWGIRQLKEKKEEKAPP